MTSPVVSVIIPTYKHRDFVLATLDSVFAQTFMDYEVIVINDGSPDDTAEVLRPLAELGRIRYIEQANTGQSKARNRGISEARGEFIALLDDDDLWPPDKLAWQVEALRRQPEVGLMGGRATLITATGDRLYQTDLTPEIVFENSFAGCPFISPGQTLIRAEVLNRVGGFNPDIWGADDWDLWLRIAKNSRSIMEDREALLYRKHDGNASKDACRMLENCLRVVDLHLPDVAPQKQAAVKRMAYQWLYYYLGGPLVLEAKQALKCRKMQRLRAALGGLCKIGKVTYRDPVTRQRFWGDVLPVRVSALLYRLAQTRARHTLQKEAA